MASATSDKPAATVGRSDRELQRLVQQELCWDLEVPEASVGVEVDAGTVTLTGTVGSFSEKVAALRAAHRVEGVLDVANDLEIVYEGNPVADDTRIAQAARHALDADSRIPSQGIQTTVAHGHLTLTGNVPTWLARWRAEQAVEHIPGLRNVSNLIQITPTAVRESQVRHDIEQALERQTAQRAKWIHVEIKDGTLTLTGNVRSWPESDAAYRTAANAPGVRSVINRLQVKPYF